ncbi:MAG: L-aspartate oxidase [Lachnospiraceae bacterium]|nr:L-aspartate oxidase [Lachnospiraceae bacterium]
MKRKADVIIVGTGAAGLFCALHLPKSMDVLMITKDDAELSDSYLAQGGISTLRDKEDYESYYEDTMKAGHYENKAESVEIMIKSSPKIIRELIGYGVDFDKNGEEIAFTREGGHSKFRIMHHKDITGKEITSKLYERVKECKNITILEYTMMIDVIEDHGGCCGIVVYEPDGRIDTYYSKNVVLATGGVGGLFPNSTNFNHLTADSLAIAIKHHIALENINYIQIHPTTLYSKKPGRRFLISESVRGEGAVLLNKKGERFVDELLPRDIVTEAIRKQMREDQSDHVYMSVKHMDREELLRHFPNIYERCLEEGYDMTKDLIPVTPSQHYFMGGIQVDKNSATSMPYLYAVGETSCNGVHGKNRLASNSLLEALVFAERAAKHIVEEEGTFKEVPVDMTQYVSRDEIQKEYRNLVLEEIKRRDGEFYAKWCDPEASVG